MTSSAPIGVLLVQLGTPAAPTPKALRAYLREFLSDRRVVDLSPWIWKPILHGMGGRFVCDFRVSDVLDVDVTRREGEAALDARINRVFVLGFPDESVKERFFGDAGYGEVKKEFFASSVGCVAAIFEE